MVNAVFLLGYVKPSAKTAAWIGSARGIGYAEDMVAANCTRTRRALMLCAWGFALLMMGCASAPTPNGKVQGDAFSMQEMLQSDSNRIATLAMRENMDSLMRLMDKLYQRNPAEWRKTAASREAAIAHVRSAILGKQMWPDLQEHRDVMALSKALSPDFAGDRVGAFIYAMGDMLLTSHGGKTSFTLVDSLDPQHVYNAARNVEIANWVLNHRKNGKGQPLLLSNHISEQERNLSFEREMGKVIARLDLVASFSTERVRRSAIGFGQSLVGGPLLQFLPVR